MAGLEPIGVGTSLCEDLASYFSRVAWNQYRAPSGLVREVMATGLGDALGPEAAQQAWRAEFAKITSRRTASLIGSAQAAATWARLLGSATGRTDLEDLTLLAWGEVLPSKRLLRLTRAWCAPCLARQRRQREVVYAPLLWQVAEVAMCPEHEVRLETRCGACGASPPIFTHWSRVGLCSCGERLELASLAPPVPVTGVELDWQRFVAAEVGSLIAATPRLPARPDGSASAAAVYLSWERSGLSLKKLAKSIGLAVSTLSEWKDGRHQPSLPGALRLCRLAGVSLVPFLRGDLESMRAAPLPALPPLVEPSRERHRSIDWVAVRIELERALATGDPESLGQIVRQLGLEYHQARRALPELCAAITSRYRAFAAARASDRFERDAQLVRATVASLRTEGLRPSRQRVQARLPAPVTLRRPKLAGVWRDEVAQS
ncbi:MAG TPA: TniQ family protein [Candidatus Dormibacteraeota bacterium]|nr:TniQ family protein [Candidatus Dormibacteraeota bacterium]